MFSLVRSFMRCRRGSTAVMFAIAAIPLIGVVGIGTEAGMWYSVKRSAQNAADAAAYSSALGLASSATSAVVKSQGHEFAAQGSFCNSGDTAYAGSTCVTPPTGTTQTVEIYIGNYTAPVFATGASPTNAVQAVVSQTQQPLLSSWYLKNNVTISVQAVAQIKQNGKPCVLALTGSISTHDNGIGINAPTCALASNDTASDAISFHSPQHNVNVGSISAAGGCTGDSTLCSNTWAYAPPVLDPLQALQTAMTGLTLPACTGGTLPTAYSAGSKCANNNFSSNSTVTLPAGIYFFSGTVSFKKGLTTAGAEASIMLLPGASMQNMGNGSSAVNITAPTTAPSVLPTQLQSVANLFVGLALYDAESGPVTVTGNTSTTATGILYFPNADVTFGGNSGVPSTSCLELIAASVTFSGSASFTNSGCPPSIVPYTQIVQLVR